MPEFHAEASQATASCLVQGPYLAAIEWDSNSRPSGQKASTLPMRHHVPHLIIYNLFNDVAVLRFVDQWRNLGCWRPWARSNGFFTFFIQPINLHFLYLFHHENNF